MRCGAALRLASLAHQGPACRRARSCGCASPGPSLLLHLACERDCLMLRCAALRRSRSAGVRERGGGLLAAALAGRWAARGGRARRQRPGPADKARAGVQMQQQLRRCGACSLAAHRSRLGACAGACSKTPSRRSLAVAAPLHPSLSLIERKRSLREPATSPQRGSMRAQAAAQGQAPALAKEGPCRADVRRLPAAAISPLSVNERGARPR